MYRLLSLWEWFPKTGRKFVTGSRRSVLVDWTNWSWCAVCMYIRPVFAHVYVGDVRAILL